MLHDAYSVVPMMRGVEESTGSMCPVPHRRASSVSRTDPPSRRPRLIAAQPSSAAASALTFSLCCMLFLSLSACAVLEPTPQKIDADSTHWVPFAFSEGESTVALKIPPNFQSPGPGIHLPETTFSRINRRQFMSAGWDYNSQEYASEFQILAVLVRLQNSLPEGKMNPETVDAAILEADGRPVRADETGEQRPVMDQIGGGRWFYYNGGAYSDSFYTRVDDHTLLWVDVSYWDAIHAHREWLASRQAIALWRDDEQPGHDISDGRYRLRDAVREIPDKILERLMNRPPERFAFIDGELDAHDLRRGPFRLVGRLPGSPLQISLHGREFRGQLDGRLDVIADLSLQIQ